MKINNQKRLFDILLIEDNPGDIRLIMEALKEGNVCSHINVIKDGAKALTLLRKKELKDSYQYPDLILLDLNMPGKDGREILVEIKSDPQLKHIPVVILTSSEAPQDILNAYNLQANCYITKPVDLSQFFSVVKSIESFWLTTAKLPQM